jgi:hypothetical protein
MPVIYDWFPVYEDTKCKEAPLHICKFIPTEQFDEDPMRVGCTVPVGDSFYYVCDVVPVKHLEKGVSVYVFAHFIPRTMDESD